MVNPKTILAEWVAALLSVPELVEALGAGALIAFYTDGVTTDSNLRLAILNMPPGSILVAWRGTAPVRIFGGALEFCHKFSLFLRAPEGADVGYEDLFNLIVNGMPSGGTLPLLHTPIDPDCEPMDLYLPTAERNTIVVSTDGATFDYFEIRADLTEHGNP
jgi:hypothetical protein